MRQLIVFAMPCQIHLQNVQAKFELNGWIYIHYVVKDNLRFAILERIKNIVVLVLDVFYNSTPCPLM